MLKVLKITDSNVFLLVINHIVSSKTHLLYTAIMKCTGNLINERCHVNSESFVQSSSSSYSSFVYILL